MEKTATLYALLYGKFHKLHARFLDSLKHVPTDKVDIVLWCNVVCDDTKSMIVKLQQSNKAIINVVFSDENVPKYKAMRRLFHELSPPKTPWVIWFDDDSWITKPDWFSRTMDTIKQAGPNCCYVGQVWYVHHRPGQWEFIKQSKWFKNVSTAEFPTKTKGVKAPGVSFITGGYWWLRADVMRHLDWPDPRLSHNGGDTLLGEAIRQQGLPTLRCDYGVLVSNAQRRGMSEIPAGATAWFSEQSPRRH